MSLLLSFVMATKYKKVQNLNRESLLYFFSLAFIFYFLTAVPWLIYISLPFFPYYSIEIEVEIT